MSRGQQQSVINTASSQNKTDFGNSQTAFGDTQGDIGAYQNQLAKFVSGNPYSAGGEYDQTIGKGLASTSDAGSNSLKGALQSQVLRTGQNSAADAATAASGAQANTRDLSTALATAQQGRISSEAGYNQQALGATATPISAESGLYGTSGSQAGGALSTQAGASSTPGFWDTLGDSFGSTLGKTLAGGNVSANYAIPGCWVAAELYGGWDDPRVHLLRAWIFGPFSQTWYGDMLSALYSKYGRWAAKFINRHRLARNMVKRVFDRALLRAKEWEAK